MTPHLGNYKPPREKFVLRGERAKFSHLDITYEIARSYAILGFEF